VLDIFISWSGPLSHDVAQIFREFLPDLLPNSKPWMSSEDIPKGRMWFTTILSQMGKSPVCIVCVTDKNLGSSWVYFEVGGMTFAMKDPNLCAYLVNVEPNDISSTPLGQLQATKFEKYDTWRLIRDINQRMETPHDEQILMGNFESKWPSFKMKVDRLIEEHATPEEDQPADTEELSAEAKEILLEAAQGNDGVVLSTLDSGGYSLQVNSKNLCATDDPRLEATWRAAVEELESRGAIEDLAGKGEVYFMRKPGYDIVEKLKKPAAAQKPATPAPTPAYDENDITILLSDWFSRKAEQAWNDPITVTYRTVDADLNLPHGSTEKHIVGVAKKRRSKVVAQGPNLIQFKH